MAVVQRMHIKSLDSQDNIEMELMGGKEEEKVTVGRSYLFSYEFG